MRAYKTGEVAKMVGLTAQTLREYENRGLLEAQKDEESGYRYFDDLMVSKAIAIRSLRNLGFTLHQVGDLFQKMDYADYCRYFDEIVRMQDEALARQKLLCELARQQADVIKNIDRLLHRCDLVEDEAFYCLDYMADGAPLLKSNRDFAVMRQWADFSMYARNYSPITRDGEACAHIMGLAIPERWALQLGVPLAPPVYKRTVERAICMMAKHDNTHLPQASEYQYIVRYAAERDLRLVDGGFIISRFTYWEMDQEVSYSMVYAPFDKI